MACELGAEDRMGNAAESLSTDTQLGVESGRKHRKSIYQFDRDVRVNYHRLGGLNQ